MVPLLGTTFTRHETCLNEALVPSGLESRLEEYLVPETRGHTSHTPPSFDTSHTPPSFWTELVGPPVPPFGGVAAQRR